MSTVTEIRFAEHFTFSGMDMLNLTLNLTDASSWIFDHDGDMSSFWWSLLLVVLHDLINSGSSDSTLSGLHL